MSENVILLGAGASRASGIPLLSEFMQTIRRLAVTGTSGLRELTREEVDTLQAAVDIRNSMREYHATVAFDHFSIEDILSILSFDVLAGSTVARDQLDAFAKAISLTIELTCSVYHNGNYQQASSSGPEEYRKFWQGLFMAFGREMPELPTIISFNYDLVLERALLQSVIGPLMSEHRQIIRGKHLAVQYHHQNLKRIELEMKKGVSGYGHEAKDFLYLGEPRKEFDMSDLIEVSIIKPHGSLNFAKQSSLSDFSLVKALDDPLILPPVFNKASVEIGAPIWKAGMEALRSCKNLIICGYSLPITDTYMQYFLKAALGPNKDIDQIFVFDPALFEDGPAGPDLRERYSKCFSTQFQKQIQYNPDTKGIRAKAGTFEHFSELLEKRPDYLLFGLSALSTDAPSVKTRPVLRRRSRVTGL